VQGGPVCQFQHGAVRAQCKRVGCRDGGLLKSSTRPYSIRVVQRDPRRSKTTTHLLDDFTSICQPLKSPYRRISAKSRSGRRLELVCAFDAGTGLHIAGSRFQPR
jgi:hypothetical protein